MMFGSQTQSAVTATKLWVIVPDMGENLGGSDFVLFPGSSVMGQSSKFVTVYICIPCPASRGNLAKSLVD